jgi:hypothetical protein
VSIQHRPSLGDRLEAAELVAMAPTVPEISERAIRGTFYLISVAVVGLCAFAYTWILIIVAIPAIWMSRFIARHIDPVLISNLCFTHWTLRRVKELRTQDALPDRRTTAKGITAGSWVYLREDYEEARRNFRAVYGRSSPPPPVPYRLAVATFPLDGHNQAVAFSDGTFVTWNSASSVLFLDHPEMGSLIADGDHQRVLNVANAIIDLVGLLYETTQPITVQNTIDLLGIEREADTRRALLAADWWRLMTCTRRLNSPQNGKVDRDPNCWLIQLSPTGRFWYLASCKDPSILRKEKGSMRNGRNDQPSINIGHFSGILNYAGRNISGSHAAKISNSQPSDDEVLSWLKTVLELDEIPWQNSDLIDVQLSMKEAIEKRDPRMPGLKQAVAKLGNFCQQIAIGVAGNGAYQLLLQHFH